MSNTQESLPKVYFACVVDGEIASNCGICVAFEAMVAAMSSNPVVTLDSETEDLYRYNLTVDNELATTISWYKTDPMINAIFQSNPTIIRLTDEQLEIGVGSGWFWNGTEFTETPQ